MPEEKIYELRADIWLPGAYYRAGERNTADGWRKQFNISDMRHESRWFIDLSKEDESTFPDELEKIITASFSRRNLNSISYKEAAREIALLYAKTLNK
jgi:hypothetical protein